MTFEARSSKTRVFSEDFRATAKFLRALVSQNTVLTTGYNTAQAVVLAMSHETGVPFPASAVVAAAALPCILEAVTVTGLSCQLAKKVQVSAPCGVIERTAQAMEALGAVCPASGVRVTAATNNEVTPELLNAAAQAFTTLATGQVSVGAYRQAEAGLLALEHVETLALRARYLESDDATSFGRHQAAFISMKSVLPYRPHAVDPMVVLSPATELAHYTNMITTLGRSLLQEPALEPASGGYQVNTAKTDLPIFATRATEIGRAFSTLAHGYGYVDSLPIRQQAWVGRKVAPSL